MMFALEGKHTLSLQFLGICFSNEASKNQQDDIFESLIHNVCRFIVQVLEIFIADAFQIHETLQSFHIVVVRIVQRSIDFRTVRQ